MTLEISDKGLFKKPFYTEQKRFFVVYGRYENCAQTEAFSHENIGKNLISDDAGLRSVVPDAPECIYVASRRGLFAVVVCGQMQTSVESAHTVFIVVRHQND